MCVYESMYVCMYMCVHVYNIVVSGSQTREPRLPPRGAANYYNFSKLYPFVIILFQFADVDILQFIVDIPQSSTCLFVVLLCVICMTVLAPGFMLPCKLKRH